MKSPKNEHLVTHAFALLCPVPEEHLLDGVDVCRREGKVAFGSRAWDVFRAVDFERHGDDVEVYIYGSHPSGGHRPSVGWHAVYVGHVEGQNGAHPQKMTFRPKSTLKYVDDNHGHWAIFWEVRDLKRLAEPVKLTSLRGLGKKKYYAVNFVPEGPLRIDYPDLKDAAQT